MTLLPNPDPQGPECVVWSGAKGQDLIDIHNIVRRAGFRTSACAQVNSGTKKHPSQILSMWLFLTLLKRRAKRAMKKLAKGPIPVGLAYLDHEPSPAFMDCKVEHDGETVHFVRWMIVRVLEKIPSGIGFALWSVPRPRHRAPAYEDSAEAFRIARRLQGAAPNAQILNCYSRGTKPGDHADEYERVRGAVDACRLHSTNEPVPAVQALHRGNVEPGQGEPVHPDIARAQGRGIRDAKVKRFLLWCDWNDPKQRAAIEGYLGALAEGALGA